MPKFCRQRFILLIYPYATERAITYVHLSPPLGGGILGRPFLLALLDSN